MRLQDLHEAKYREHPAVNLVYRSKANNKPYDMKFPHDQLEEVVKALTNEFGKPEWHQGTWMTGGSTERWVWDNFQVANYASGGAGFVSKHSFGWLETSYGIR